MTRRRAVVVADRTAPDVDIDPMRVLGRDGGYRTFDLSDCATAVDAYSYGFHNVVGWRRPSIRIARFVEGHLAKRYVFGKSTRREFLVCAREQGEQGAARRIGPASPAVEPRRDAGAIERVFEDAEIGLRRPEENRHLIEGHAAGGFP